MDVTRIAESVVRRVMDDPKLRKLVLRGIEPGTKLQDHIEQRMGEDPSIREKLK